MSAVKWSPNTTRSQEAGFTFVEVLLTLLILAITTVPLLRLYATAVEQAGVVGEFRVALDLAREEVEKVKNLALTEDQIKAIGNVVSPPIVLNRTLWYTVRVVDAEATPLRLSVYVFRDQLAGRPVVSLVTVLSK